MGQNGVSVMIFAPHSLQNLTGSGLFVAESAAAVEETVTGAPHLGQTVALSEISIPHSLQLMSAIYFVENCFLSVCRPHISSLHIQIYEYFKKNNSGLVASPLFSSCLLVKDAPLLEVRGGIRHLHRDILIALYLCVGCLCGIHFVKFF